MQPLLSDVGLKALDDVLARVPLLAFDFDGTLAPIVARPEQARMPASWAASLSEIATLYPVGIVTGRAVDDVTARLSFRPTYVIGNHGAEDPSGAMRTGSVARLDPVRARLLEHAAEWTKLGIGVEDKRYSLALHYRQAPDPDAAASCIEALLSGISTELHLFPGKFVVNVAPSDAPDKSDAVISLVQRAQASAAVFCGDDANDEPVFVRAPADWITVKVGRDGPPSRARFYLESTEDMGRMLQQMLLRARARRDAQSS